MKVFFAGGESPYLCKIIEIVGGKNVLFSFYHWAKVQPADREDIKRIYSENDIEVICDSGLFTLMFGAGKGGNYDRAFMREYTTKYIAAAKEFGIKNLTIVESDVHKILGMDAVHELRKYFEDSGMKVLYVWHREEGIDGLLRMCEKYKYIALSVPELRILFKGNEDRYQDAVFDLLNKIRGHCPKKIPRIHLLGNTVQETMETTIAYSCDSTSWISGWTYGRLPFYIDGRLKIVDIRREPKDQNVKNRMNEYIDSISESYPEEFEKLKAISKTEKSVVSSMRLFCSAKSMVVFQHYLDKHYPWIGLEERSGIKSRYHSSKRGKHQAQSLESK